MSPLLIQSLIASFVSLFLLLIIGVPIAFTLLVSGLVGFAILVGLEKGLSVLSYTAWSVGSLELLVCVPLFIIMGRIALEAGLTEKVFRLASSFMGWLKGGLAMAVVASCGLFGAVSGSSASAVATIGPIAIPEMSKYNYDKTLSGTVVASAGPIAMMIPPSISLIYYGYLTDTSISRLFMAGVFPGIITIIVFSIVIYFVVIRKPHLASGKARYTWHQRGSLILNNLPIGAIAMIVLGGIYFGWFTPTEAGAVGLFLVFCLAMASRRLGLKAGVASILDTAKIMAMVMFILIGATTFATYITISGICPMISEWIVSLGLNRYVLISVIFLFYIILGCFIDGVSMLVLTLPVLFPIVTNLGFDPVWFGIFVNIASEIALITPPVGMNVYILEGAVRDKDVKAENIFRTIIPFVIAQTVVFITIVIFPQICLWLPSTMD